jgi:hypothetical protein
MKDDENIEMVQIIQIVLIETVLTTKELSLAIKWN